MWTDVVLGVVGMVTTAGAGLGQPILSSRRARADQNVEARKAAYEACLLRWRQVEEHVRHPDFAQFMVYGERLGDLWVLASQVKLYGSTRAAELSEEVTRRLVDWAMWAGAPRKSVDPEMHGFPEVPIADFTREVRRDLRIRD